jgi:hypothetical protein
MQSVPITTKVVCSNPVQDEVYSIQHYVIKFVGDMWQVGGFLTNNTACHNIAEVLLKVALNTINPSWFLPDYENALLKSIRSLVYKWGTMVLTITYWLKYEFIIPSVLSTLHEYCDCRLPFNNIFTHNVMHMTVKFNMHVKFHTMSKSKLQQMIMFIH